MTVIDILRALMKKKKKTVTDRIAERWKLQEKIKGNARNKKHCYRTVFGGLISSLDMDEERIHELEICGNGSFPN